MLTELQYEIEFEYACDEFITTGDEAEFRRALRALGLTSFEIDTQIKDETA